MANMAIVTAWQRFDDFEFFYTVLILKGMKSREGMFIVR